MRNVREIPSPIPSLIPILSFMLAELCFRLMDLLFDLFCTILYYSALSTTNLNNSLFKLNNKIINLNNDSFNLNNKVGINDGIDDQICILTSIREYIQIFLRVIVPDILASFRCMQVALMCFKAAVFENLSDSSVNLKNDWSE